MIGGIVNASKAIKYGYPVQIPYLTIYEKHHFNLLDLILMKMNTIRFNKDIYKTK